MNKTLLSLLAVALVASLCAIYLISPLRHEISSFQLAEEAAIAPASPPEDDPTEGTDDSVDPWDNEAYKTAWDTYKEKFHKVYKTLAKEKKAFDQWFQNKKKISSSSSETWVKGETVFSDLSDGEFSATYLNLKTPKNLVRGASDASLLPAAPDSVDWRAAGKVTPVKNQGGCGSCWAFSTVGALESLSLIRDGKNQSLSEQQLVDCTLGLSSLYGCGGGWPGSAMDWAKTNGNTLGASYPYNGKNFSNPICPTLVSSMKSYGAGSIASGNLDELARAVATQPVVVCIDASTWGSYKTGIMTGNSTAANHAVLLVGYTPTYWLIKNSWGTWWGDQGYIKLARGNTLGIANYATFPLPKAPAIVDKDANCVYWKSYCKTNAYVIRNFIRFFCFLF